MATAQAFPSCCGATIITGFNLPLQPNPYEQTYPKWNGKTYVYPEAGKLIKDEAGLYKHLMVQITRNKLKNHMYVCILNKQQAEQEGGVWLRVLKKVGFEFLCHHHNSMHPNNKGGSDIYLFTYLSGDKKDRDVEPKGWSDIDLDKVKTPKKILVAPTKKQTMNYMEGIMPDVKKAVEVDFQEYLRAD